MKRYCAWPGWGFANIITDVGASVSRAQRRAAGLVETFGAGERRRSRAGGKEQQHARDRADFIVRHRSTPFVIRIGGDRARGTPVVVIGRRAGWNG